VKDATGRRKRYEKSEVDLRLGGKEEVVGSVGRAEFLAGVIGIATRAWRFATFGVDALDGGGSCEDASAFMADDVDEEPGDGIGVGRGSVGDGLAVDATGIAGHPGWPGEMFAEEIAVGVEEVGVGSFENPGILAVIRFAGVDLIAFGVDGEEELFAGGRLESGGDLLGGGGGDCEKEDERSEIRSARGHEVVSP
jgi:hypothetical protein